MRPDDEHELEKTRLRVVAKANGRAEIDSSRSNGPRNRVVLAAC